MDEQQLKEAIKKFVDQGEFDKTWISAFNKLYGSVAPYKIMLQIALEVNNGSAKKAAKK